MEAIQLHNYNSLFNKRNFVKKPWGGYADIEISDGSKIKKLIIKPNARTSLQLHHYRAENWIVVKGAGVAEIGSKTIALKRGVLVQVPIGEMHRISNQSNADLEIIEVQIGAILDENDILRLEDDYGRAGNSLK